jgi:hypothetical protein
MRFDPKKSFGYPVLRKDSSDYVSADISTSIELLETQDSSNIYEIEYHVMIGVREIKDAILSRDLSLVVSFFCPKTLYSASFITQDLTGRRPIDMRNIKGDLFIEVEVVVNSSTYSLKSDRFNPEFSALSESFVLNRGDLVAQGWPEKLFIEREVFQSVVSLFQWAPDDEMGDGAWKLLARNDTIQIVANQNQIRYLTSAQLTKEGRAVLLNSIIFPAIIQLISTVIADEFDDSALWFKVLEQKLQATGDVITENSDPIALAQKLLKNPLATLNETIFLES